MLALKSHFVTMSRNWDQVQRVRMGLMRLVPSLCLLLSFVATCRADSKAHAEALVGKQVVPKCPYIGFRVGKEIVDINHWQMPVFRVEEVKGTELRLSCEAHKDEATWVAIDDMVELDDALALYSLNIEAFADDYNSRRMRGIIWIGLKEYQKAENDITALIEKNPEDGQSLQNRGCTRFAQNQFDRAIADFNAVLNLDSEIAPAYLMRGQARTEIKQYERAIRDLNEAVRLEPESVQARFYRGRARGYQGDHNGAIADYTGAIQIDPEAAYLYDARGYELCCAKKDYNGAIADLDEVIRLEPGKADAWFNRGCIWLTKGDPDKGLKDFSEAIRLDPSNVYRRKWKAKILLDRCDFAQALADLDALIRLAPDDAQAYAGRAAARVHNYDFASSSLDFKGAISDLSKQIELSPKDPEPHRALAKIRLEADDPSVRDYFKAIEEARTACELTSWKDPQNLESLACAHEGAGHDAQALEWQKKAIVLWPDGPLKKAAIDRLKYYEEKIKTADFDPKFGEALLEQLDKEAAAPTPPKPSTTPGTWLGKRVVPKSQLIGFRVGNEIVGINHWPIPIFQVKEVKGGRLRLSCERMKGGEAWVAIGDVVGLDDAIAYFSISIAAFEWDIFPRAMRGLVWARLCEYRKAERDFTAAIELDPENTNVLQGRGFMRLALKEYDLAIADFNAVLNLNPENAPAYAMRGMARLEKKQYDRAIRDFDQALSLEPEMPMIRHSREFAREASRKAASVDFDVQLVEGLEELLEQRKQ